MQNLLLRIYSSKKASLALKIICHAAVIGAILSYFALLIYAYKREPWDLAYIFVCSAVPFVIVTVVRKFINAPRPYDTYEFYTVPPKSKVGESFPSRHVFSCFLIATSTYTVILLAHLS